uniref:Biliverdin reductase A n=1 Tax=Laticauda laticaudata TaxID=8630 RepID=A0A8C5WQ17_LATLA
MFGTVVIGIGIAGSVRIRDLLNPLPSKGPVYLFNLTRCIIVRQMYFLEAGKHVLVEYPLALSAKIAHEVWELAELKDKILHVEHIELLTEEYKQLKKEVSGKELVKGTLHFTGGPLDERYSGFPSFSGIARLTWLVDLFGDLTVTSATREQQKENNYFRMTVHFQTGHHKVLADLEEAFQAGRKGKWPLQATVKLEQLPTGRSTKELLSENNIFLYIKGRRWRWLIHSPGRKQRGKLFLLQIGKGSY